MKLVAAFAAAALVVLAPGTASADVSLRRDPAGDMASSPVGSSAYVPAPTQVQGDIVATRVFHGRRAIRVQVQLRDLAPIGNGSFHVIAIRSKWRQRTVEIDAFPAHWEGRVTTTDAHGRTVSCAVRHRIDYDLNRVLIRMPRSCLHRPPWVQVAIRTTVAGSTHVYADDAGVNGFTGAYAFGPRVRS